MSTEAFGKLLGDARWSGKIFNGKWVAAKGGARDVPEPATGKPLCNVGFADASDIEAAAAAAAAAQAAWAGGRWPFARSHTAQGSSAAGTGYGWAGAADRA